MQLGLSAPDCSCTGNDQFINYSCPTIIIVPPAEYRNERPVAPLILLAFPVFRRHRTLDVKAAELLEDELPQLSEESSATGFVTETKT